MGTKGTFLAITLILGGCGASMQSTETSQVHPQRAEARAEAIYAGALSDAVEAYEAEIEVAASLWYPSYSEAFAAAQELIEPNLDAHVRAAVEARGRTMEDLNSWAAAHPEFVLAQNAAFEARIASLRPGAFAVMGRIDGDLAPPSLLTPESQAPEGTTAALASR